MSDNLELTEDNTFMIELRRGWALFDGAEGDSPDFVAFFQHKSLGERLMAARDENGEQVLCDPALIPALIDCDEVIVCNDFRCETPEQIESKLANQRLAVESSNA